MYGNNTKRFIINGEILHRILAFKFTTNMVPYSLCLDIIMEIKGNVWEYQKVQINGKYCMEY